MQGDDEAATKTNEEFVQSTDGFLKKTPILGHARACIAYLTGDKEAGDETMSQATNTTVGMALVAFFLHGGFWIGSGCWIVAQRVKEVDVPDTASNPSRPEIKPPCMKRVSTTSAALHKLEMLDQTFDLISPTFFAYPISALCSEAAAIPDMEFEDSVLGPEVTVIQFIPEEDEEEMEWEETSQKRQISQMSSRSIVEGRRRLHEWRQSMLTARL
jgi:hypothetical protein